MELTMIEYKKIQVSEDDKYIEELLNLSKAWANEGCCSAYYENEPDEFINHEVYIAIDQERIIAYALGNVRALEEKTSYNTVGEKCFELDEIFVDAKYRNQGIGQDLFRFIEQDVKTRVDLIGTIATSNNYDELLRFYIDELSMEFKHALLIKRMK